MDTLGSAPRYYMKFGAGNAHILQLKIQARLVDVSSYDRRVSKNVGLMIYSCGSWQQTGQDTCSIMHLWANDKRRNGNMFNMFQDPAHNKRATRHCVWGYARYIQWNVTSLSTVPACFDFLKTQITQKSWLIQRYTRRKC